MKPEPLKAGCAREIAGLSALPRAGLVERWIELHGSAPLKTMTKDLLARGIAYEMQIQQRGGLAPAEKRALATLARGKGNPNPGAIKAGTRLYRSWQGVTQEVLVMDSGYSWRDKSYASLSEVARAITGTHIGRRAEFG